jgi:hypothetical protein
MAHFCKECLTLVALMGHTVYGWKQCVKDVDFSIYFIKGLTRCTLSSMCSLFHDICSTCFGCPYTHHRYCKLQSTAIGVDFSFLKIEFCCKRVTHLVIHIDTCGCSVYRTVTDTTLTFCDISTNHTLILRELGFIFVLRTVWPLKWYGMWC